VKEPIASATLCGVRAPLLITCVAVVLGAVACPEPPVAGPDGGPSGGDDAGQGPACSVDDDCAFGERCRNDVCEPAAADIGDGGCASDDDCGADEICATSTGQCVSEAPVPNVPTGPPGPCIVNEERTCGLKVGVCDYGIERCVAGATGEGQWSGECLGAVGPSAEACDGDDDDCDGTNDNGFLVNGVVALGEVCTSGGGACELPGVATCTNDGTAAFCDVPVEAGETCNGVDDDGDGCVDEGFALSVSCEEGLGGCRETGATICNAAGDGVRCSVSGRAPTTEVCDNDDDDCDTFVDNGCDDDLDGHCDATLGVGGTLPIAACTATTNAALLDCNDTNPAVHPGLTEICNDGLDTNCDGNLNDGCAPCNPALDADFDGSNQCNDCDETNGAIFPGATERCDGLDQNCNGQFDEPFDNDGDGFTTCGTASLSAGGIDPARTDCNDANASVFPGACELCANAGGTVACGAANDRGNDVDEDCDGFVDELCAPCDAVDRDGDGASECEGDCAPTNGQVRPGVPERCDGFDTDCNTLTVENCDVGDECNFAGDADVCRDRLICVESLSAGGNGTGDFSCTSFCNTTTGGLGLGDSCDADETCGAPLTPTSNLHGCSVTTGFGALGAGTTCSADSQCRSGRCVKDGRFTGNVKYCFDFCGSDAYCPTSPVATTCQAFVGGTGTCLRLLPGQTRNVGDACAAATAPACVNGSASCVGGACRELCCGDADCAGNQHCSLDGPSAPGPAGGVDTVPVCLPDSAGNGGRPSGAACDTSAQCESEFCDESLRVCMDPCCNDTQCPVGLICESALANLAAGQSFVRMCLSSTPADPLEAR
jgi:hypothetical protein